MNSSAVIMDGIQPRSRVDRVSYTQSPYCCRSFKRKTMTLENTKWRSEFRQTIIHQQGRSLNSRNLSMRYKMPQPKITLTTHLLIRQLVTSLTCIKKITGRGKVTPNLSEISPGGKHKSSLKLIRIVGTTSAATNTEWVAEVPIVKLLTLWTVSMNRRREVRSKKRQRRIEMSVQQSGTVILRSIITPTTT